MARGDIRLLGGDAFLDLGNGTEAVIDAADIHLVEGLKWYAEIRKTVTYVKTNKKRSGRQFTRRLHRVIMAAPKGIEVDHKDGDGLNNRRTNLRFATRSQSIINRSCGKAGRELPRGVQRAKSGLKFQAKIVVGGQSRWLGTFTTSIAASEAYERAAERFHGEFMRPL